MPITGSTRIVGLFGDPVAHSLSPLMHNAALAAAGINAVYVPFHVAPDDLPAAVESLRALRVIGVNLTIPHKEAVLPLLDEVDPRASLCGAVNTIVNRDGRLVGYNTDGCGLLQALRSDLSVDPAGRRILLAGAGGAARGALMALAAAGAAWIGIANRTTARAEALCAGLADRFPATACTALPLDHHLPGRLHGGIDLLINCTSIGLHGEAHDWPALDCLASGGVVFDMVYGREPTALVRDSLRAGVRAADGLGMLAGQGEEAFSLWFGAPPPPGALKAALNAWRDGN